MNAIVESPRSQPTDTAAIHPVILSGGSGTRLWPLSRSAFPKQLLALTSQRSMIQETVGRTRKAEGFADPIVICNDEHRFVIEEQLREIEATTSQIILEPIARNTGPAVTVAALCLADIDPDALMLVEPSDHVIGSLPSFREAIASGISAARSGKLVTFGVKPTRPETGYGYLRVGAALNGSPEVRVVDRFTEKPDHDLAAEYVASGEFLWNSGIFLLSARHYLDELARLNPAMWEACKKAFSGAARDHGFLRLDAAHFGTAPAVSVDRAVMELTDRAVVVPVEMEWNDVGSWQALHDVNDSDADGNVVHGDVVLTGVSNSYIRSDGRLVAAIGLENVVVVSTDDAVLVSTADRASEVSAVVERLRRSNRHEPLHHTTIHRPWGYYRSTDSGHRFQVKRIMVKPGARLSLQKHYHRAEHWVVVQGTAIVQRGTESLLLRENESIYIPIGVEHRLENPGKLPLHLIEVQSGGYLGEDDIVRTADNYGRA